MVSSRKPMSDIDRQRLNARRKRWTHPRQPSLSLPRKTVAALALIETGVRDYDTIATAVGLSVDDVSRIDSAKDESIRRLGVEGIPRGEYFPLSKIVRCPGCGGCITVAPCISCQMGRPPRRGEELADDKLLTE